MARAAPLIITAPPSKRPPIRVGPARARDVEGGRQSRPPRPLLGELAQVLARRGRGKLQTNPTDRPSHWLMQPCLWDRQPALHATVGWGETVADVST